MGRVPLATAHLIAAVTDGISGQSILAPMVKRLEWDVSGGFIFAELKAITRQGANYIVVPLSNCRNISFTGPEIEEPEIDEEAEAEAAREAEILEAETILAQTNAALARLRSQGKKVDPPRPGAVVPQLPPRLRAPLPSPVMAAPVPPPPPDRSSRAGRLRLLKQTDPHASPLGPGTVPIDEGAQARIESIAASNPVPEPSTIAEPPKRGRKRKA